MQTATFLSGQFLLAMPGIGDPRFDRAVIAMCSHDETGALGIGIGTVIDGLSFHDMLTQLDIAPGDVPDVPVHLGGPCETRRGFVLHSRDWGGADTIDVLRAIAGGTGPRHWLPALGYAGWDAGQLDGEMQRHGWFNVAGDDALLFDTPAEERWTAGFEGVGIDPRMLAATTGTA